MPSSHLILSHPFLLMPPIPPSIRVFSNESVLRIRWPKYWSFSFSSNPSDEYSGLISFRTDWLDLLAVQGTLKSLLQHHSSKASILRCSAFFIVHLSHPYMTTGKTIALTRQTFVGKVMSLLFNMLSRLVITFLSRIKRLKKKREQILAPFSMRTLQVFEMSCQVFLAFNFQTKRTYFLQKLSIKYGFIYSFIHSAHIFEHVLCIRHCARGQWVEERV